MSHSMRIAIAALLFGALSLPALADSATYLATIDTASQIGNYGYIDLELNASSFPGSGPVEAAIFNFTGATLNPLDPANDELGTASGGLPGPLTLDNSGFNDSFEGMTFGSDITFDVTLSGSGVSLTGGAPYASGTTFQVLFCDSTCSNTLFTSDPNTGAAALLNVAPDGSVEGTGPVTFVPEPGCLSLILCGSAVMLLIIWRKRPDMETLRGL